MLTIGVWLLLLAFLLVHGEKVRERLKAFFIFSIKLVSASASPLVFDAFFAYIIYRLILSSMGFEGLFKFPFFVAAAFFGWVLAGFVKGTPKMIREEFNSPIKRPGIMEGIKGTVESMASEIRKWNWKDQLNGFRAAGLFLLLIGTFVGPFFIFYRIYHWTYVHWDYPFLKEYPSCQLLLLMLCVVAAVAVWLIGWALILGLNVIDDAWREGRSFEWRDVRQAMKRVWTRSLFSP